MPFPWKKVKTTKISQLVNHHLHKRRDGSSLVVETGFPTSLIDLFIKNRDKLKKSSKKKRQSSFQNDPVIARSPTLFPSPPQSPSPMNSPVITILPTTPINCSSPSLLHLPSADLNEIDVGYRDGGVADGRGVDTNGVILVVVKIFLVAILALRANRLTVGITMFTFLLVFLEYAAKHLPGLSKPCSKAREWLISMLQKVPKLLRYNKVDKVDQKKDGASLSLKFCESRHQIQEIDIEEPNQYPITLIHEIQPEKEIVEVSCFKGISRNQENESKEVVIGKEESLFEVAKPRSKLRKDKIKSKMKIFEPKNFRSLRKEHNFRRLKVVKEDNFTVHEEQGADGCEDERVSEITSRFSSTASGRFKQDDGTNSMYAVGDLAEIDEEVATNKKVGGEGIKSGLSWSYFVLCLTVLIGLIGGRAFALLLTLSWFLVLKFGKTLARYREVPMIKSFSDKSD